MSQFYQGVNANDLPPEVATSYVTNSGTSVPVANVENILGNNTALNGFAAWTTGSGNTTTIDTFGLVKWVVNPIAGVGTHQTIQSAINAASAGDTIFITQGTYTENVSVPAGIDLTAFNCNATSQSVVINGTLTYSGSGTSSLSGLCLQTNSNNFLLVSGSNATIVYLDNCYFNVTNFTGISYTNSNSSSAVYCFGCDGNIGASGISLAVGSSAGLFQMDYCLLQNSGNSTTPISMSSGVLKIQQCKLFVPLATSGNCQIVFDWSDSNCSALNTTCLTIAGSSSFNRCTPALLASGTASAINISSTIILTGVDINSGNQYAITGSGTIDLGSVTFSGSAYQINPTVTIAPNFTLGAKLLYQRSFTTPGSYPYTILQSDDVILAATASSAPTIIPLASPITGQQYTIKDASGNAGINNITITPSGKNIDGSASYVIAANYGAVDIAYNGTQWNVL